MDAAIDVATLELLARWRKEDATDNPAELLEAEQELAAFKRGMNDARTEVGESRSTRRLHSEAP